MNKQRRHFAGTEKVAILKRHLIDKVPVSNLCDEFRADEQHRRLAVIDNDGDFRSGQSPVHRRHHHIGLIAPSSSSK